MGNGWRCCFILLFFSPANYGQNEGSGNGVIPSSLLAQETPMTLEGPWRFFPEDHPKGGSLQLDDRQWALQDSRLSAEAFPEVWHPVKEDRLRVGWFRLHLEVDQAIWGRDLMYQFYQAGSAEIYLDGERIAAFGGSKTSEPGLLPKGILRFSKEQHLLAIRYQIDSPQYFHQAGFDAGFRFSLGPFKKQFAVGLKDFRSQTATQIFFVSLLIFLGMLHLVLLVFMPTNRANLYYALTLLAFAGSTYLDYQHQFFFSDSHDRLFFLRWHRLFVGLTSIAMLRFVYAVCYPRLPRRFWLFVCMYLTVLPFAIIGPTRVFFLIMWANFIKDIEIIRVITSAFRAKKEGVLLLAAGLGTMFFFGFYDVLLDFGLMAPIAGVNNTYFLGAFGLFGFSSVYLARDMARSNRKILKQEKQAQIEALERKLLEADNTRKTQELEEARALQLSMLPKQLPQPPGFEIAAYMQTATEVGGDYYDFHYDQKGPLTIAVGDATGHGLKAGAMVTAFKSLFMAGAHREDLVPFVAESSKALKAMGMPRMFFALHLLRIQAGSVRVVPAGMPPLLIWRSAKGEVEEVKLSGMPLSCSLQFPYREYGLTLEPGDLILILSDGLPELFNEKEEMLDNELLKKWFLEAANQPADAVLAQLVAHAEEWRGKRQQDDDMTFVAVRYLGDNG